MVVRNPKSRKVLDGLVNTVNVSPLRNRIPGVSRMNGFAYTILAGDTLNYNAGTNAIVVKPPTLRLMSFGLKFTWSEPSLLIHCGCFGYHHPPCPMALR
jgi:hypothetical protein